MNTPAYLDIGTIASGKAQMPERIDSVSFAYRGVALRCIGFLHGVTGGPSAAYRRMVQSSIDAEKVPVYAEKGLNSIYRGIDCDLQDWAVVHPATASRLAFAMTTSPLGFFSMVRTAILEHMRKDDPYLEGNPCDEQDIGRSMAFHQIDPEARRALAGAPSSEAYLRLNIARQSKTARSISIALGAMDHDWRWLSAIEPWTCIPLRSLHMLEFCVEHARLSGFDAIAMYVGELHQTDARWIATNTIEDEMAGDWSDEERKILDATRLKARVFAQRVFARRTLLPDYAAYVSGLALGTIPVAAATVGALIYTLSR